MHILKVVKWGWYQLKSKLYVYIEDKRSLLENEVPDILYSVRRNGAKSSVFVCF